MALFTEIGSDMLNEFAHPYSSNPLAALDVRLIDAKTPAQLAAAAELMRAFVSWQHVRHAEHRERIDAYFDPDGFDDELARLPEPYERPGGALLLAKVGSDFAGCIALKPLGDGACEMKRLYLKPEYHACAVLRKMVVISSPTRCPGAMPETQGGIRRLSNSCRRAADPTASIWQITDRKMIKPILQ